MDVSIIENRSNENRGAAQAEEAGEEPFFPATWGAILKRNTATPKLACEILGLKPKPPIPAGEVKTAYRAAIVRAHPDKGGSNEHAATRNAFFPCSLLRLRRLCRAVLCCGFICLLP